MTDKPKAGSEIDFEAAGEVCECCGLTHTETSSDEEIESHFDRIFAFLASKRCLDPIPMVLKSKYEALRARLAEVSEAAKTLLKYNNGVGRRCSDPHLKALEAILAKGDTK